MAARYEAWECGCRLLEFPSCRFKDTMVGWGVTRTQFFFFFFFFAHEMSRFAWLLASWWCCLTPTRDEAGDLAVCRGRGPRPNGALEAK